MSCRAISTLVLANTCPVSKSAFFCVVRTPKINSQQRSGMWYSIVRYSHHTVRWIPQNEFTLYVGVGTLWPPSILLPLSPYNQHPLLCSLRLWVRLFLDSTCKWDHTVFVFVWLILLSIMSSLTYMFNGGFVGSRNRHILNFDEFCQIIFQSPIVLQSAVIRVFHFPSQDIINILHCFNLASLTRIYCYFYFPLCLQSQTLSHVLICHLRFLVCKVDAHCPLFYQNFPFTH